MTSEAPSSLPRSRPPLPRVHTAADARGVVPRVSVARSAAAACRQPGGSLFGAVPRLGLLSLPYLLWRLLGALVDRTGSSESRRAHNNVSSRPRNSALRFAAASVPANAGGATQWVCRWCSDWIVHTEGLVGPSCFLLVYLFVLVSWKTEPPLYRPCRQNEEYRDLYCFPFTHFPLVTLIEPYGSVDS